MDMNFLLNVNWSRYSRHRTTAVSLTMPVVWCLWMRLWCVPFRFWSRAKKRQNTNMGAWTPADQWHRRGQPRLVLDHSQEWIWVRQVWILDLPELPKERSDCKAGRYLFFSICQALFITEIKREKFTKMNLTKKLFLLLLYFFYFENKLFFRYFF